MTTSARPARVPGLPVPPSVLRPPLPSGAPAGAPAGALTGVMPAVPAPGELLIGVAIPVPQPWAAELEGWRCSFGDPLGASVPAHVTLVPPTAVPAGDLPAVHEHLARATAPTRPFRLQLEGTGTFRPVSPVVFVRVADGARQCTALERRVRAGVLGTERRFPYHPHVTVAQQLADDALDRAGSELQGYAAVFEVAEVGLFMHGRDGVWRSAAAFRLGG